MTTTEPEPETEDQPELEPQPEPDDVELPARDAKGRFAAGEDEPGVEEQAVTAQTKDYLGRLLVTPASNSKDYMGRLTTATVDYMGRTLLA